MQLIILSEALQWKGSCVARVCPLREGILLGAAKCYWFSCLVRVVWDDRLVRVPQHHTVLIIGLLAGVIGVMAPPWHIKMKPNPGRPEGKDCLLACFCQCLYLAESSLFKNWNGLASHLFLTQAVLSWVPFLSDWLKEFSLAGREWIRQVFTSLPFLLTETSVSITSILSYWELWGRGRRALWGTQHLVEGSWLQPSPEEEELAGGLQYPEDWLAAPLGPPEPVEGLNLVSPEDSAKGPLPSRTNSYMFRKKKCLTSLLWFTHLAVSDVGWRDLSSEES